MAWSKNSCYLSTTCKPVPTRQGKFVCATYFKHNNNERVLHNTLHKKLPVEQHCLLLNMSPLYGWDTTSFFSMHRADYCIWRHCANFTEFQLWKQNVTEFSLQQIQRLLGHKHSDNVTLIAKARECQRQWLSHTSVISGGFLFDWVLTVWIQPVQQQVATIL